MSFSGYPGNYTNNPQQHPPQGFPTQNPSFNPAYQGQQPPQGYQSQGQPPEGYLAQGQPPQGYPSQGQPPQGYPSQGQPPQGYQSHGQPPQGFPSQGQPPQGHPGQQPQGYTRQGPAPQGYPGQAPYPGQQPSVDPSVLTWFRAVDQDNSGQINSVELKAALQNGNWSQFSDEACRLMIGMFDEDHSGTMNVNEFDKLFKYISQWTEVYKRYDKDNSGTVDEKELAIALQEMGYRLSPQFINMLVVRFGGKDRKVTLDNFIVSNVQIHKLTEAFKRKDVAMQGVVSLNYEEFMGMAFSCT